MKLFKESLCEVTKSIISLKEPKKNMNWAQLTLKQKKDHLRLDQLKCELY